MQITLKIKKLPMTEEFRVSVFKDGVYSESASYYTDDLNDAKDTMRMMLIRFQFQGHTVSVSKKASAWCF